jgi:hypothetical protein
MSGTQVAVAELLVGVEIHGAIQAVPVNDRVAGKEHSAGLDIMLTAVKFKESGRDGFVGHKRMAPLKR